MRTHVVSTVFLAIGLSLALLAFGGARTEDELGVAISPQKLLLGTVQSGTVTVHTDIPLSLVAEDTLELEGIAASSVYADSLGHLVAAFPEADVKGLVSPPSAVLTLTGSYTDGEAFSGADSVMVTYHQGK
jgi:hypothetical protein